MTSELRGNFRFEWPLGWPWMTLGDLWWHWWIIWDQMTLPSDKNASETVTFYYRPFWIYHFSMTSSVTLSDLEWPCWHSMTSLWSNDLDWPQYWHRWWIHNLCATWQFQIWVTSRMTLNDLGWPWWIIWDQITLPSYKNASETVTFYYRPFWI